MAPRITIAVPCYNQAVFLFECLNSLLAQTLPDWEAVVVDDCSVESETIASIVHGYGDERIRCLRHEKNSGLAASRNTALRSGRGPFVLCLDSDDFLHPEFLASTVRLLENDSKFDCSYADFQLVGLSNGLWSYAVKTADELAVSQWIPGAGTLMRRSVWEGVGGFCESEELRVGNEDWDFWIAATSSGLSPAHVPRPLYFYRRHASSMSVSKLAVNEWKTREFMLQRHTEFFSVGTRSAAFRSGGFLSSSRANKFAGRRFYAYYLYTRAILARPSLILENGKNLLRKAISWTLCFPKRLVSKTGNIGSSTVVLKDIENRNIPINTGTDWDEDAIRIHTQYGYLSHDYKVVDEVIEQLGAKSVLEIGCGTGRLVPAYLKRDLNPILLYDISLKALDLCRERFRPQTHIRLFSGPIESIQCDASVDLVVSTRILQHILSDDELRRILKYLAPKANAFYINELTEQQALSMNDPRAKGRDYTSLFEELSFRVAQRGTINAERATMQEWVLFVKMTDASPSRQPESLLAKSGVS